MSIKSEIYTDLLIKNNNPNYSIINTITDPNILTKLSLNKNNIAVFSEINNNPNGFEPTNKTQVITAFNKILQETPLKIACCNSQPNNKGPYYPLVRKPANNNYGFVLETMNIPANTCPINLYPDSPVCNAFYDVYCENIFNVFNNSKLPQEDLLNYAPECACYIPKTISQSIYPDSTPSTCYKPDCNMNTSAYLDTISRNNSCNLTVCQNILNAQNITAGGKVSINPTLKNNCGQYIAADNNITIKNINSLDTFSENNNNNNNNNNDIINNIFDFKYTTIIIAVFILLLCCCFCIK